MRRILAAVSGALIISAWIFPLSAQAFSLLCTKNPSDRRVCYTDIPAEEDAKILAYKLGNSFLPNPCFLSCSFPKNPGNNNCAGAPQPPTEFIPYGGGNDPTKGGDYFLNCIRSDISCDTDEQCGLNGVCANNESCYFRPDTVETCDGTEICAKVDRTCTDNNGCTQLRGKTACKNGSCYMNREAMDLFTKQDASFLGIKADLKLQQPLLEIHIPGLHFTDLQKTLDGEGFLHIPYIPEYLAALYKFGMAVASILAVVMIIGRAFDIAISPGGENKAEKIKRIGQVVIGLLLVWGSYFILYSINPDLVSFRVLKVQYIQPQLISDPGIGDDRTTPSSDWTKGVDNYNVTDQCFPLSQGSLQTISWNWGGSRDNGARCHAAIDIYSQGPAQVVAIDDGTINHISPNSATGFKTCQGHKTIAVLIYHPKLAISVLYGEIDIDKVDNNKIKKGATVTRGQLIGAATYCGMLHFEAYSGNQPNNARWLPPAGQNSNGASKCARSYLSTKPPQLKDPTNLINGLQGKWCAGSNASESGSTGCCYYNSRSPAPNVAEADCTKNPDASNWTAEACQ